MALNPQTLHFLVNKLHLSESSSFTGVVSQVFDYLSTEVKDNPIYEKYEAEREKWVAWPIRNEHSFGYGSWELPGNLEDAKSLSYDIYKSIASNGKNWAEDFATSLFAQKSISENFIRMNNVFLDYFIQVVDDIVNANPEIEDKAPKKTKNTTVFIIHGKDKELKVEVQLLLRRAGVNNIVLHEQADKGRTIIDKLIQETQPAAYAIALLSPDDLTVEGNNRARQNVILEVGYFLGFIGKERIRMIVKGEIEIPSDLQGILYEKHDEAGAWKIRLLKEIQAVGIYIDMQSAINEF